MSDFDELRRLDQRGRESNRRYPFLYRALPRYLGLGVSEADRSESYVFEERTAEFREENRGYDIDNFERERERESCFVRERDLPQYLESRRDRDRDEVVRLWERADHHYGLNSHQPHFEEERHLYPPQRMGPSPYPPPHREYLPRDLPPPAARGLSRQDFCTPRRRRHHLDDIYFPNYDEDDVPHSSRDHRRITEEYGSYHYDKFSRGPSVRVDVRRSTTFTKPENHLVRTEDSSKENYSVKKTDTVSDKAIKTGDSKTSKTESSCSAIRPKSAELKSSVKLQADSVKEVKTVLCDSKTKTSSDEVINKKAITSKERNKAVKKSENKSDKDDDNLSRKSTAPTNLDLKLVGNDNHNQETEKDANRQKNELTDLSSKNYKSKNEEKYPEKNKTLKNDNQENKKDTNREKTEVPKMNTSSDKVKGDKEKEDSNKNKKVKSDKIPVDQAKKSLKCVDLPSKESFVIVDSVNESRKSNDNVSLNQNETPDQQTLEQIKKTDKKLSFPLTVLLVAEPFSKVINSSKKQQSHNASTEDSERSSIINKDKEKLHTASDKDNLKTEQSSKTSLDSKTKQSQQDKSPKQDDQTNKTDDTFKDFEDFLNEQAELESTKKQINDSLTPTKEPTCKPSNNIDTLDDMTCSQVLTHTSTPSSPQAVKKDIAINLKSSPLAKIPILSKDFTNKEIDFSDIFISKDISSNSLESKVNKKETPNNSTSSNDNKNNIVSPNANDNGAIIEDIFILEDEIKNIDDLEAIDIAASPDKNKEIPFLEDGQSKNTSNCSIKELQGNGSDPKIKEVPRRSKHDYSESVKVSKTSNKIPKCYSDSNDVQSVKPRKVVDVTKSGSDDEVIWLDDDDDGTASTRSISPATLEVAETFKLTPSFINTRSTFLYTFHSQFDDHRVVDMDISHTPSPSKNVSTSDRLPEISECIKNMRNILSDSDSSSKCTVSSELNAKKPFSIGNVESNVNNHSKSSSDSSVNESLIIPSIEIDSLVDKCRKVREKNRKLSTFQNDPTVSDLPSIEIDDLLKRCNEHKTELAILGLGTRPRSKSFTAENCKVSVPVRRTKSVNDINTVCITTISLDKIKISDNVVEPPIIPITKKKPNVFRSVSLPNESHIDENILNRDVSSKSRISSKKNLDDTDISNLPDAAKEEEILSLLSPDRQEISRATEAFAKYTSSFKKNIEKVTEFVSAIDTNVQKITSVNAVHDSDSDTNIDFSLKKVTSKAKKKRKYISDSSEDDTAKSSAPLAHDKQTSKSTDDKRKPVPKKQRRHSNETNIKQVKVSDSRVSSTISKNKHKERRGSSTSRSSSPGVKSSSSSKSSLQTTKTKKSSSKSRSSSPALKSKKSSSKSRSNSPSIKKTEAYSKKTSEISRSKHSAETSFANKAAQRKEIPNTDSNIQQNKNDKSNVETTPSHSINSDSSNVSQHNVNDTPKSSKQKYVTKAEYVKNFAQNKSPDTTNLSLTILDELPKSKLIKARRRTFTCEADNEKILKKIDNQSDEHYRQIFATLFGDDHDSEDSNKDLENVNSNEHNKEASKMKKNLNTAKAVGQTNMFTKKEDPKRRASVAACTTGSSKSSSTCSGNNPSTSGCQNAFTKKHNIESAKSKKHKNSTTDSIKKTDVPKNLEKHSKDLTKSDVVKSSLETLKEDQKKLSKESETSEKNSNIMAKEKTLPPKTFKRSVNTREDSALSEEDIKRRKMEEKLTSKGSGHNSKGNSKYSKSEKVTSSTSEKKSSSVSNTFVKHASHLKDKKECDRRGSTSSQEGENKTKKKKDEKEHSSQVKEIGEKLKSRSKEPSSVVNKAVNITKKDCSFSSHDTEASEEKHSSKGNSKTLECHSKPQDKPISTNSLKHSTLENFKRGEKRKIDHEEKVSEQSKMQKVDGPSTVESISKILKECDKSQQCSVAPNIPQVKSIDEQSTKKETSNKHKEKISFEKASVVLQHEEKNKGDTQKKKISDFLNKNKNNDRIIKTQGNQLLSEKNTAVLAAEKEKNHVEKQKQGFSFNVGQETADKRPGSSSSKKVDSVLNTDEKECKTKQFNVTTKHNAKPKVSDKSVDDNKKIENRQRLQKATEKGTKHHVNSDRSQNIPQNENKIPKAQENKDIFGTSLERQPKKPIVGLPKDSKKLSKSDAKKLTATDRRFSAPGVLNEVIPELSRRELANEEIYDLPLYRASNNEINDIFLNCRQLSINLPRFENVTRLTEVENECTDTVYVCESVEASKNIEVIQQTHNKKQPETDSIVPNNVSNHANNMETTKENSKNEEMSNNTSDLQTENDDDDVIMIKPDIPMVDLTSDDKQDSENDQQPILIDELIIETKKELEDLAQISGTVTLYRSDEAINTDNEVHSVSATIPWTQVVNRSSSNSNTASNTSVSNISQPALVASETVSTNSSLESSNNENAGFKNDKIVEESTSKLPLTKVPQTENIEGNPQTNSYSNSKNSNNNTECVLQQQDQQVSIETAMTISENLAEESARAVSTILDILQRENNSDIADADVTAGNVSLENNVSQSVPGTETAVILNTNSTTTLVETPVQNSPDNGHLKTGSDMPLLDMSESSQLQEQTKNVSEIPNQDQTKSVSQVPNQMPNASRTENQTPVVQGDCNNPPISNNNVDSSSTAHSTKHPRIINRPTRAELEERRSNQNEDLTNRLAQAQNQSLQQENQANGMHRGLPQTLTRSPRRLRVRVSGTATVPALLNISQRSDRSTGNSEKRTTPSAGACTPRSNTNRSANTSNVNPNTNMPNVNQNTNTPNVNQNRNVPNVNQNTNTPNVNQNRNVPNLNQNVGANTIDLTNDAAGPLNGNRGQLNGNGELSLVDRTEVVRILSRHIYFYAGLCHAQNVYIQDLKRRTWCQPYFNAEINVFDRDMQVRLQSQALRLYSELHNLVAIRLGVTRNLGTSASLIIDEICNNLVARDMPVQRVTRSLIFLLAYQLMLPQAENYARIPLFKALLRLCHVVINRMNNRQAGQAVQEPLVIEGEEIENQQVHPQNRVQENEQNTRNPANQHPNRLDPRLNRQHSNSTLTQQPNYTQSLTSSVQASSNASQPLAYHPSTTQPTWNQSSGYTQQNSHCNSQPTATPTQQIMGPPPPRRSIQPQSILRSNNTVPLARSLDRPGPPNLTIGSNQSGGRSQNRFLQPLGNNLSVQPTFIHPLNAPNRQNTFIAPRPPINPSSNMSNERFYSQVQPRCLPGGPNTNTLGCTPRYIPNYDSPTQNQVYAPRFTAPSVSRNVMPPPPPRQERIPQRTNNQPANIPNPATPQNANGNMIQQKPCNTQNSLLTRMLLKPNNNFTPNVSGSLQPQAVIQSPQQFGNRSIREAPPTYEETIANTNSQIRQLSPTSQSQTNQEDARKRNESLLEELLSSDNTPLFAKPASPVNDNFRIKLPFTKPNTPPTGTLTTATTSGISTVSVTSSQVSTSTFAEVSSSTSTASLVTNTVSSVPQSPMRLQAALSVPASTASLVTNTVSSVPQSPTRLQTALSVPAVNTAASGNSSPVFIIQPIPTSNNQSGGTLQIAASPGTVQVAPSIQTVSLSSPIILNTPLQQSISTISAVPVSQNNLQNVAVIIPNSTPSNVSFVSSATTVIPQQPNPQIPIVLVNNTTASTEYVVTSSSSRPVLNKGLAALSSIGHASAMLNSSLNVFNQPQNSQPSIQLVIEQNSQAQTTQQNNQSGQNQNLPANPMDAPSSSRNTETSEQLKSSTETKSRSPIKTQGQSKSNKGKEPTILNFTSAVTRPSACDNSITNQIVPKPKVRVISCNIGKIKSKDDKGSAQLPKKKRGRPQGKNKSDSIKVVDILEILSSSDEETSTIEQESISKESNLVNAPDQNQQRSEDLDEVIVGSEMLINNSNKSTLPNVLPCTSKDAGIEEVKNVPTSVESKNRASTNSSGPAVLERPSTSSDCNNSVVPSTSATNLSDNVESTTSNIANSSPRSSSISLNDRPSTSGTSNISKGDAKKIEEFEDDVETVDLTWIDDMDDQELQKEMDFVFIKKEEPRDDYDDQKTEVVENNVVPSPADSGCCSPIDQAEEEGTSVFVVDRLCICSKVAQYNCACGEAWYCGEECQLNDWESHQKVCQTTLESEDEEQLVNQEEVDENNQITEQEEQ